MGETIETQSQGDRQYDAFINALKKVCKLKNKKLFELLDYAVRIPSGSHSDVLCETIITWDTGEKFNTRGLSSGQAVSAIKATERMLNLIEMT